MTAQGSSKAGRRRQAGERYPGGKLKPIQARKPKKREHRADRAIRKFSWEGQDAEA